MSKPGQVHGAVEKAYKVGQVTKCGRVVVLKDQQMMTLEHARSCSAQAVFTCHRRVRLDVPSRFCVVRLVGGSNLVVE